MSSEHRIFVIDDNEIRSVKLTTILNFIGEATCVAHYAKDLSTRLVADKRFPRGVRPYTVREYARLQGVPDTFTFAGGDNDAYRMIGNGVSVPVGEWIGAEIVRYFE